MKRFLLTVLLLIAIPCRAGAEGPSLTVWNAMSGRINPLGIEDWLMVGLRQSLYQAKHVALNDNWIWWGALLKLSPSAVKIGPHLEIQPLSILQLRFTAEIAQFWGVFTTFQSFGSPLDDWSDTTLHKRADMGMNYSATTVHLGFSPTLQVAIGPIVLRDTPSVDYWNATLRPGDTVFYETTGDTLAAPGSVVISNDADVLWRSTRLRLLVGVRHTIATPLYPDGVFRPGEPISNPNAQQRLQALARWTFYHRPMGRVRSLSGVLVAGWYLQHRYRTGADVNAGVPYGLAALVIETDYAR